MSIDLEKYRAVAMRWDGCGATIAAAAACLIEQLCDEIARLRMTDAERETLTWCEAAAANVQHPAESVLRSLRERHAP